MSDDNAGNAAPAAAPAENTPAAPTGDEGVQDPNSPEAGDQADDKPDGEGDGEGSEEEEKDDFEDDGEEPEVKKRMTAKDFIIARKNKQLKKAQEAAEAANSDGDGDDDDPEGDPVPAKPDGNDPKDNEDGTEAELEAMRPIVEQHLADQDAQEVTAFLEEYPELAKYAGKVERLMKHDSRRHIPVRAIFFEVAGDHLMKIGADRARAADAKAKGTQAGGDSNRGGIAPKDWSTATKEELEAEKMRVRQNAR